MSEEKEQRIEAAAAGAPGAGADEEAELESVSELDEEVEEIIEEGVERDDSPPVLHLRPHGDVNPNPVRLYLANASDAKAHWSIIYGNTYLHGDQDSRSFNVMSVPYMPSYTICYWSDPTTRSCVEVDASDCVVFNGQKAIRTAG